MEKLAKKYLEKTEALKPFLKTYLELRRLLQSYDWSQSDLSKPPFYSRDMMLLRDKLSSQLNKVYEELSTVGFENVDLTTYLQPFMIKIDELTPLKNGNTERTDIGDEDSQ